MEKKYEVKVESFKQLKGEIVIPKFQRGLVWNTTKKKEFIKSLKAGLPIGVLLLSRKDGKYHVVDGLQRFSTMLDYSKNYFEYIDESEVTDLDVKSIIMASTNTASLYEGYPKKADQEKIVSDIRDVVVKGISNGGNKNINEISWDIASNLCSEISIMHSSEIPYFQKIVFSIVDKFCKNAEIDNVEIPLLIFTGPYDELASIFQKLNQEGVKLSKYDIYAATWIDKYVYINGDIHFIDFIINKYEDAKNKSNLEIADYDPEEIRNTGKLTVFEYAFGIGKALKEKCTLLFPGNDDDSKIESIGFLILAEILGLTYQTMGELADTITSYENLDCKALKDAIVECAVVVEKELGKYIVAPRKKQTSLACHSELQLASYIIVLFKMKYEITKDKGISKVSCEPKEVKEVKKYLHKHYLFDIIKDFWSGSGDSKLEELVAHPTICRYTKDVDQNSFEQAIRDWLVGQNIKRPMKSVSAQTKLFLNYLLRLNIDSFEIDKKDFDVEHCVPKDLIDNHFLKKDIAVPMSSVCNLVYIPKFDNQHKGEKTYYQRRDDDATIYVLNNDMLDKMSYPERTELKFVESVSSITEENYFSFLNNRANYLTNKIINGLYK